MENLGYWHAVGRNNEGQCNVSDWHDIVAVTAGDWHTIGLKRDGTLIAVGNNRYGQCNVNNWRDIVPAVIAHEFHHNIRFSYFDWDHGNVTVGDYLIIEGLAESFARELYGDEFLGPWVTSFDKEFSAIPAAANSFDLGAIYVDGKT